MSESEMYSLINNSDSIGVAIINENILGDSVIINDSGNSEINGGAGYDKYVFKSGDGHDTIIDSNGVGISVNDLEFIKKRGCVEVNGIKLTGGEYDETTGTYTSNDAGVRYDWNGINGSDLTIHYGNGDSAVVKDYWNGDLDILFDRSIVEDKDDIPEALTKSKQTAADLQVHAEIAGENSSYNIPKVEYIDDNGKVWDVINCENTDRLLRAYGEQIKNGIVDLENRYILIAKDSLIELNHTAVDYSSIVSELQGIANGTETPDKTDIPIQNQIRIPTSAANGSPVMQDIFYIYTTKPSNAGLFAKLFSLMASLSSFVSGNFIGGFYFLADSIYGDKIRAVNDTMKYLWTGLGFTAELLGEKASRSIMTFLGNPSKGGGSLIGATSGGITGAAADIATQQL